MPVLYLISVVLVLGSTWVGLSASDAYDQYVAASVTNASLQQELEVIQQRRAQLEAAKPGPLRPSAEALSVFFSRMVEAGEVVGAGVRVEPRGAEFGQQTLQFEDPGGGEVGINVCRARLQAAMEGDDTIPVMSMVEEEMQDMPVTVVSVLARRSGRDFALTVDVDIFGRTQ